MPGAQHLTALWWFSYAMLGQQQVSPMVLNPVGVQVVCGSSSCFCAPDRQTSFAFITYTFASWVGALLYSSSLMLPCAQDMLCSSIHSLPE